MALSTDGGLNQRDGSLAAFFLYPLAHMAVEVYNGMLSVMWPLFVSRFGLAFSAIGLLTLMFRTSMALPQIGFAALADRMGSRWIAIGGLLFMAAGMSLTGLAPSLGVLVVLLIVAPLGSAAFHPAGAAHMSRSLPQRRATALAVFMIGGTLGMSLGPLVGAQVYTRVGLSGSALFLPLGIIVALLMFFFIRADASPVLPQRRTAQQTDPIPQAIYFIMGVAVIQAWLESGWQSYLTTLLTGRGESLVGASQALFLYAAAAAGGVFLGGTLADRMPRWRVVVLSQVMAMPLYAATLLLGGQALLLASAGLGFFLSLGQPVTIAIGQELMPSRTSLASALTMGISWVIGSVGVVVSGFVADRVGLQSALLLNTLLPVVGVVCILRVRHLGRHVAPGRGLHEQDAAVGSVASPEN